MPLPAPDLYPSPDLYPGDELDLSPFAQALYDELAPLAYAEPANGNALGLFCSAIADPYDEMWDLVVAPDKPWTPVVDLDNAPSKFIDWLGRFKGVAAVYNLADVARRDRIRTASGFARGRSSAIIAAAKSQLTGSQHVVLQERTPTAWSITVSVYASELLTTVANLRNAILEVKPAAIRLILDVSGSETWNDVAPGVTWDTVASVDWDHAVGI